MKKILVIVGPTATGKSDLAVQMAKKINGEIISADSRQVYKGLDIGTGKIKESEMQGIKHYLLDVADPKKQFSVVKYVELAEKAIEEIFSKNKLPIIVGGTGFYIQALVDGIILPDVSPNKDLRKELNKKTSEELFEMLKKLDLQRAEKIDPKNSRRLIRAIEIASALGKVPAIKKSQKKYEVEFIGLTASPENLKERIKNRLDKRIEEGMIDEVKDLHTRGLSWKRMNELGLEYRYIAQFLQGKMTEAQMKEKLATEIWRYAKRQITWFKNDKRIDWRMIS
jgi:tRNA dimethylallyltransferase